jgi:acetate CoA/acetoacetate CoA-transferase alpha subunit
MDGAIWIWLSSPPPRDKPNKSEKPETQGIRPMKKGVTPQQAAEMIPDGAVLMIGGFMGVGSPHRVIDALVDLGRKNLTIIANDTARPNYGIGKLVRAGAVARAIVSHIGLNPETQKGMIDGSIAVDLVPQGTLAERIRAGGFGLGGVLTKTGLGTIAAKGQKVIEIDGEDWLYAPPLKADFALIHADRADYSGNLTYQLTATNFNPVMAMAGETVIAEPREISPVGVIPPDHVSTSGVLVDYIILRGAA